MKSATEKKIGKEGHLCARFLKTMSVGADVISVFERKSEKAVAHVKCASFSADCRYLLRMESCRDHNAINSKIVISVVGDR